MGQSANHPPTQPRNGHKISQRGMLSLAMLLVSLGALSLALLGGIKIVADIFSDGIVNSLPGMDTKVIVIGLAYMVGWVTAMVAIRVYGNLVLPMLINWFTWGCLVGICILYVKIMQKLYMQEYDTQRFWAYLFVMAGGLIAMVGLHLIIENHDLRPFSIPLLIISLIQLGLIVARYVFTDTAKPGYVWGDLIFFFAMSAVSILMLAHIGLLEPLRIQLTNYFDNNSKAIQTQE